MELSGPKSSGAGRLIYGVALIATIIGSGAVAQDIVTGSGNQSPQFAFSYGVDLTTNYLSKGLTQTDDGPAVQPYAEFGYGPAYFGLWASNASFGGAEDTELDVSIGVRPEFGDLTLDLGFAQYFYQEDDADYGEAYLFADYAASENVSLSLKYYREVYADKDWVYVGAGYSDLPWGLTASGGVGSDLGSDDNFSEDSVAVDFGISGDISENGSFDFRVSDSSIEGTRFYATISFYN